MTKYVKYVLFPVCEAPTALYILWKDPNIISNSTTGLCNKTNNRNGMSCTFTHLYKATYNGFN